MPAQTSSSKRALIVEQCVQCMFYGDLCVLQVELKILVCGFRIMVPTLITVISPCPLPQFLRALSTCRYVIM